ncbi:hypothetical protein IAU59_001376 [Kwoniella sp. CBS 9459]
MSPSTGTSNRSPSLPGFRHQLPSRHQRDMSLPPTPVSPIERYRPSPTNKTSNGPRQASAPRATRSSGMGESGSRSPREEGEISPPKPNRHYKAMRSHDLDRDRDPRSPSCPPSPLPPPSTPPRLTTSTSSEHASLSPTPRNHTPKAMRWNSYRPSPRRLTLSASQTASNTQDPVVSPTKQKGQGSEDEDLMTGRKPTTDVGSSGSTENGEAHTWIDGGARYAGSEDSEYDALYRPATPPLPPNMNTVQAIPPAHSVIHADTSKQIYQTTVRIPSSPAETPPTLTSASLPMLRTESHSSCNDRDRVSSQMRSLSTVDTAKLEVEVESPPHSATSVSTSLQTPTGESRGDEKKTHTISANNIVLHDTFWECYQRMREQFEPQATAIHEAALQDQKNALQAIHQRETAELCDRLRRTHYNELSDLRRELAKSHSIEVTNLRSEFETAHSAALEVQERHHSREQAKLEEEIQAIKATSEADKVEVEKASNGLHAQIRTHLWTISELKKDKDNLRDQRDSLSRPRSKTLGDLKYKTDTVRTQLTQIEALKKDNDELRSSVANAKLREDGLLSQVQDLKMAKEKEKEDELTNIKLLGQLAERDKKINSLEQGHDEMEQQLMGEIDRADKVKRDLTKEIQVTAERMNAQTAEMETQKAAFREDCQALQDLVDKSEHKATEAQKTIETLRKELQEDKVRVQKEQEEQEGRHQILKIKLAAAAFNMKALKGDLAKSKSRLEGAEGEKKKKDEELAQVHSELKKIKAQNVQLSSSKAKIDTQLTKARADLKMLNIESQRTQRELTSAREQLKSAQASVKDLNKRAYQVAAHHQAEAEKIDAQVKSIESQIRLLGNDKRTLKRANESSQAAVERLEKELAESRRTTPVIAVEKVNRAVSTDSPKMDQPILAAAEWKMSTSPSQATSGDGTEQLPLAPSSYHTTNDGRVSDDSEKRFAKPVVPESTLLASSGSEPGSSVDMSILVSIPSYPTCEQVPDFKTRLAMKTADLRASLRRLASRGAGPIKTLKRPLEDIPLAQQSLKKREDVRKEEMMSSESGSGSGIGSDDGGVYKKRKISVSANDESLIGDVGPGEIACEGKTGEKKS